MRDMKTACPHCHTVFRVSEQTLLQSAGQVRCGHCLAIFTADVPQQMSFDDLLEAQDDVTDVVASTAIADESITKSTLRGKAGSTSRKPDAALGHNTEPRLEQSPAQAIGHASTESDDVIVAENSVAEVLAPAGETGATTDITQENSGHILHDVIPPALRAEARTSRQRSGFVSVLFWSLAIWLMIVIGIAQYAWHDRIHLLQYPQARPWFELVCSYANCQLPEPRDASRIELSRKNIYTHPNDKHGLMVSGSMVNQADYAQSFPILELRFENIRGETIAARRFIPEEYLDLPKDKISKMQPGEPVMFTLEIVDPGPDVVSYEFTFL